MTKLLCLILLTYTLCSVQCARILLIFALPEKSHYILGSSLAKALAGRGHDVTLVSPFVMKNAPFKEVHLSGFYEAMQEKLEKNEYDFFKLEGPNPFENAIHLAATCTEIEAVFQHKNFEKLMTSQESFDVVIVEQFLNNAFQALSTHFRAPLIIFSSLGANFWVNSLTGNPSPTSYIPDIMLNYFGELTFWERLTNTCVYLLNELVYNYYVYPTQNEMINKYIPNGPHINDVLYNASIIFLNSHPSTVQAVPLVPNMIEVGGMHVQPPQKLSQDLQKFLDEAKNGVIYFSMGSNVRSAQFPQDKLVAFLDAFSKLNVKVLWKWEQESLPGQPQNVKIQKWLPQQDILAHPNIKLFITHGGLLSITEAIYHGVPILAIPVFGDQKINAKMAVNGGYGLLLPYDDISEKLVTERIMEILNNAQYKNNAKIRSRIFHDRLVGPMDTAIYWVEYVIRHKGAPHLRVSGVDLPWYKYFLVDVVGFIIGVIVCFAFVLKKICQKLCKQKTKKIKQN